MEMRVTVISRCMTQALSNQNKVRDKGELEARGILWRRSRRLSKRVSWGELLDTLPAKAYNSLL